MKAMLIAIFRAMQRRKLGTPEVKTSANTFRTNNVVHMDRRMGGTATGRKATRTTPMPYKADPTTIAQAQEDGYRLAREACESAWPQPSFNIVAPPDLSVVGESETVKFASGGGAFDGGGSSGDWSSSSSDSGSSSSGSE